MRNISLKLYEPKKGAGARRRIDEKGLRCAPHRFYIITTISPQIGSWKSPVGFSLLTIGLSGIYCGALQKALGLSVLFQHVPNQARAIARISSMRANREFENGS